MRTYTSQNKCLFLNFNLISFLVVIVIVIVVSVIIMEMVQVSNFEQEKIIDRKNLMEKHESNGATATMFASGECAKKLNE